MLPAWAQAPLAARHRRAHPVGLRCLSEEQPKPGFPSPAGGACVQVWTWSLLKDGLRPVSVQSRSRFLARASPGGPRVVATDQRPLELLNVPMTECTTVAMLWFLLAAWPVVVSGELLDSGRTS